LDDCRDLYSISLIQDGPPPRDRVTLAGEAIVAESEAHSGAVGEGSRVAGEITSTLW